MARGEESKNSLQEQFAKKNQELQLKAQKRK